MSVVLALTVHFSITLMYAFRGHLPGAARIKVDRYMVPLFHQNWRLFAPDLPRYNCELEFRIAVHNEWTDWADASAFYGASKSSYLETLEQSFVFQLNSEVLNNLYRKGEVVQFDRVTQSAAYANALYMVIKNYRNHNDHVKEEMAQIRLHYLFTPPPGGQFQYHDQVLEFPIYIPES